jgi:hypothetical protein
MTPHEKKTLSQISLFPLLRECQRLQDENENLSGEVRRWRECAEALGAAVMHVRWPKQGGAYEALLKLERLREGRS